MNCDASTTPRDDAPRDAPLPRAVHGGGGAWLWIVPIAALVFATWVVWQAWRDRGLIVTISFAQGHGILAGDAVKYRGIAVGEVRDVRLLADGTGVEVVAALRPEAAPLAREGTRFWLVRPEFGLQGIRGLDTLIGARYIELSPGEGEPARSFAGIDAPPVVGDRRPGDLDIVIECPRRGSLSPGSPLSFRQVQVGVVDAVRLAPDGTHVEARAVIEPAYAHLVRDNTVFWDSGGIEVGVGLKGLTASVESPAALLRGGISFATPNDAGPRVDNGHRFGLAEKFEESWLRWKPPLLGR